MEKEFHCVVGSFSAVMDEDEVIKNTVLTHRLLKNFLGNHTYSVFVELAKAAKAGEIVSNSDGVFVDEVGNRLVTYDNYIIYDSFYVEAAWKLEQKLVKNRKGWIPWQTLSMEWESYIAGLREDRANRKIIYA